MKTDCKKCKLNNAKPKCFFKENFGRNGDCPRYELKWWRKLLKLK